MSENSRSSRSNTEGEPLVSVIIPTYNNEDTIERSIRSVVDQTYDRTETIIVNDASTDGTGDKLKRYEDTENIHIITHHSNRGGAAARNSGFSVANGDFIAFLDADDEWEPTKLKDQIEYMMENGFPASYTAVTHKKDRTVIPLRRVVFFLRSFVDETEPIREGGEELIKRVLNLEFDIGGTSTLVVTSDLMTELAGFDPQFSRHTDWEFLVRLLKKAEIGYVDEPLVVKYHTGSPSVTEIENAQQLLFKKFGDEIATYTQQGVPIRESHQFRLAEKHFFKGEFLRGINRLRHLNLTRKMLVKLSWASIRGLRAKVRGR